jgi:hypothetical protein
MILLLADAPFGPNIKVSNWDITTGLDQLEVSMAKSPSWIAAHWIDLLCKRFCPKLRRGKYLELHMVHKAIRHLKLLDR